LGIATTLRTTLKQHHAELFRKFGEPSVGSDASLVEVAVSDGQVSRFGRGRGLGLRSSHQQAKRFGTRFSVRQETFCIEFSYRKGSLVRDKITTNLLHLRGTHNCFDLYLD